MRSDTNELINDERRRTSIAALASLLLRSRRLFSPSTGVSTSSALSRSRSRSRSRAIPLSLPLSKSKSSPKLTLRFFLCSLLSRPCCCPPERRPILSQLSLLPKSLPSLGVRGNLPLLESPVELAGLSLLIALPANGLGFAVEAIDEGVGILEASVSGRDRFFEEDSVCGRLSGFKEAEGGIWEMRVVEPERARERRVKPEDDSD